ncbi:hypothetical protein [Merismopedia glauca]|uniref:Uncharacterized protein n=1 Tax=Merismopedia glauca CCAP 1448/3 TaxID=1296344 RepID=A0A2T1C4R4_9CYAN|nr:hypothetical protein [Merismopedia glauca]PSB03246.1 hypothetical protein C7B64_09515 [Merismopedia glauca CCAP 1448/3]
MEEKIPDEKLGLKNYHSKQKAFGDRLRCTLRDRSILTSYNISNYALQLFWQIEFKCDSSVVTIEIKLDT